MRKTLLILLLSGLFAAESSAQEPGRLKAIDRIVESIDEKVPLEGRFHCNSLPGKPLLYCNAKDGVTVQIGVSLFSDLLRSTVDTVVCECIERLWLELLLCKDIRQQKELLKMKRIAMAINGFPLGSKPFLTLAAAADVIRHASSCDYSGTSAGITVTFQTGSAGTSFRLTLPSDPAVLFPFDKKEHEEFLAADLRRYRGEYGPGRLGEPASVVQDGAFLRSGNRCYLIDSLTDGCFYKRARSGYAAVVDGAYPLESFRNMVLGAVPSLKMEGVSLKVHMRAYNPDIKDFTISLNNFLGKMQRDGLEAYTGRLNASTVLVVFHHPVYNYIHMISVRIPSGSRFPSSECSLAADLSAFIPQNNIKNLFEKH